MNINRKQILESFLETIEGISDKEYQKRVWIEGLGPEVDDFDETACYFIDEGKAILEKHQDFGLTEPQYRLIRNLQDEFRAFSREHDDFLEEDTDTPEWARIMEMAKEVLEAFEYKQLRNFAT